MNLMDRIQKKNILVVGDVMLDMYYFGEVRRISPEAPVPVFCKRRERSVPGGAANVAANLAAANQAVSVMSVIGDDAAGGQLKEHLHGMGVDGQMIYPLNACTTEKVRFIAENNQQVLRLDNEAAGEFGGNDRGRLLALLEDRIEAFDLVVLSDYNKGFLTEDFTQGVIDLVRRHKKRTLVDVKGDHAAKYAGAYLVKPNLSELRDMTQMPVKTDGQIVAASNALRGLCGAEYVLTTCGGRGMVLVGEKGHVFVDADDREVFDVTGAGDTALAYLAASLANGFPVIQAVEVANHAAGIQVSRMGTSTIGLREVSEAVPSAGEDGASKILDRGSASKLRRLAANRRLVFTNGCFDILHVGHVRYLRKAAEMGDMLVVGLNSDDSVRRLKGGDRPVNPEADRAELLASLEFIDYVVIFEEDTPYELIRQIEPDILVKGGDYTLDNIVGKDIVEARGGKVVLIDLVEGRSTTDLIHRIREGEGNEGTDSGKDRGQHPDQAGAFGG